MTPEQLALRQCVLAVCVLDDVDLMPADDGVVLTAGPARTVPWSDLAAALAGADPDSDLARLRIAAYLHARRAVADAFARAAADQAWDNLLTHARPVGLPTDHALHPGADWARQRILGGALDLGLGFLGIGEDPDHVMVVPPACLVAEDVDAAPCWPGALGYLERMGAIAATRLLDGSMPVLRPIGDCDVVTLLGSRTLRSALAAADGTGMRTAAVPMRRRGWLDLTRIDPAFTIAAAAATDPAHRGFSRPLLVTADEISLATDGGRPAELPLRDPGVDRPQLPVSRLR